MSNPLVAQAQSQTTGVTGIGIAESAVDLANGVSDGSWVEAGLGAVGVGLEVLSLVVDPIGTLASYGVSWLIEHVQPLKEALDWLAGDPPVIQSFSDTWANVAAEVNAIAGDLGNEVTNGTAGWQGEGAEAYRGAAAEQADALAGAASLADGISAGVMIMGTVVAAVRELVRDLVAELVGKLITWALEAAGTLGFATPVIAVQATTAITKTINKISEFIRKLVKTIGNVSPKIRKIIDKLGEIIEKLSKMLRKGGKPGSSTTPSSAKPNTTKTPDTTPNSPDTTPNSTDTPSGADTPGTTPTKDGPGQSDRGNGNNRPKDADDTKTPEQDRQTCNDPIDVVTGEMVLGQTDVRLDAVLPLVLRRTHVSSYRAGQLFGRSWASTMDQRLEFDDEGVVYVGEDGMLLVYPDPPVDGEVLPRVGPRWPLARTATGFAITRPQQADVLHFEPGRDRVHWLGAVENRAGVRIHFDREDSGMPTSVRHDGGYRIEVDSRDGRVRELRLHSDAGDDISLVRFTYHDTGHLAEVINSSNSAMRFDYDHAGRIVGWTDRNGEWYRYLYDGDGRCVANQGSGGFLNGTFTYEPENLLTRFTDALGRTTTYRYNEARRVIAETDPLGHTTTQEWDELDQLRSRTDPLGRTTRYAYDEAGNLVALTRPDGSQALSEYNRFGRPTTVIAPDGAVWRQDYDHRGLLVALTDPAGATTRYAYDERGHLTSMTDAAGGERRVETNAAGLAVATVDPLGAAVRYTRDQFGRVSSVTDPLGAVTTLTWTVEGRPLTRTYPDGGVDRWRYDGEGNQVEHVDPAGRVTRMSTTHFDLPASRTDPDGSTVWFAYDETLQLISVTNAHGAVWQYTYDAAGNVVSETDFDGRQLTYRYDAAGSLIARTNGVGETTELVRDALGNVIEQWVAGEVTRFEYDPAGRLVRATSPDAELSYTRDVRGSVLTESVNGRTVTSRYDVIGRRVARITPGGVESTWTYDANHQPVGLTTARHALSFGYDVTGHEVERLLDSGTVVAQTWDTGRRLESQTVSVVGGTNPRAQVLQRRRYHYRSDGYVSSIDDHLAGTRRFQLDPVGRITGVDGASIERYSYDAAGNIATAGAPAQPEAREYEGSRLRAAGGVSLHHDAQGRVVAKQQKRLSAKPASWQYSWDAQDRLTGVVTPDGTRWRYRYDPLGRRIAKQRLAADGSVREQVDFAWDGTTLAEQSHWRDDLAPVRTTTWERAPGGVAPLVQFERSTSPGSAEWFDEQFYSIVTDLLGTPAELITDDGRLAWRRTSTAWGKRAEEAPGTPFGFPGQYHDVETGLEYNLFRYYDTALGNYYSSDPLGLAGGFNPHGYVPNTTVFADPLGLTPCRINQLRMDLGRAGMSVRDYDIVHVPEIIGPDGRPAYARSPANAGVDPRDPDVPMTGPRGRPLIEITDRGLENRDTAIASLFHEIYHQDSRRLWGHGGTEAQAEEYGQRMLAEFNRRTGRS
ncbi:DUF6531 domain-containing protein [Amycolatopsis sp. 195334CR]|uniref:DUF6531 domain-containing protein n=1 Tax=Amycolatopsis sp. 195334CR TaxID=2814588 RepID=UPI001A8BFCB4|nr:DUF6531 domain-containing protein [Amycolatopsis sp. 195334CR]MBN6035334.1 RHS domain-containing protein [Amycolatopsis sp. 195334CR]